jgi:hypothetical protein
MKKDNQRKTITIMGSVMSGDELERKGEYART